MNSVLSIFRAYSPGLTNKQSEEQLLRVPQIHEFCVIFFNLSIITVLKIAGPQIPSFFFENLEGLPKFFKNV